MLDVIIDGWLGQKHNFNLTFCVVTWVWTQTLSIGKYGGPKIQMIIFSRPCRILTFCSSVDTLTWELIHMKK